MSDHVQLERRGAVAVLTIRNSPIRNALTPDICLEMVACFDEVDADEAVGCLVVRGADGTFCSGADTRTWADAFDDLASDRAMVEADTTYNSFYRLGHVRVPTIAAVRGAAVGAGLNLALACDLRIVADDARLISGFLKAGIHPGGGFYSLAGRVAGREATAAMGLFSEEVSGTRAVEVGMAWEAVPDEHVDDRALELADRVAADPALSRRAVRSFRLETNEGPLPWAAALEVERGVQSWSQGRRLRQMRVDNGHEVSPS